jgi:hypothetical protein
VLVRSSASGLQRVCRPFVDGPCRDRTCDLGIKWSRWRLRPPSVVLEDRPFPSAQRAPVLGRFRPARLPRCCPAGRSGNAGQTIVAARPAFPDDELDDALQRPLRRQPRDDLASVLDLPGIPRGLRLCRGESNVRSRPLDRRTRCCGLPGDGLLAEGVGRRWDDRLPSSLAARRSPGNLRPQRHLLGDDRALADMARGRHASSAGPLCPHTHAAGDRHAAIRPSLGAYAMNWPHSLRPILANPRYA